MPNTNFQIIGPPMKRSKTTASASASATGHAEGLSDLPDDIICQILCLMETRDAIRLCATLKRWRYFWTSIPILYFNSESFKQLCNFKEFINRTVTLRSNSKLKVLIYYRFGIDHLTDQDLLTKVLEYVASHDVEEIRINLWGKQSCCPPFEIPVAIFNCKSLKRLELKNCCHKEFSHSFGFDSLDILHLDHSMLFPTAADHSNPFKRLEQIFGFTKLTTLHLNRLILSSTEESCLCPFASCVNLKNLQLAEMSFESDSGPRFLVLSAPKLSNLNLLCNRFRRNIVVVSPQPLNVNYLYFTPKAFMNFRRTSLDVLVLQTFEKLDPSQEFHPSTRNVIPHRLVNVLMGDHEAEPVKISFCRVAVKCGAAALTKLESLHHSRRIPLEIGVGSFYILRLHP